jgi:hypothetical protein
MGKGYGKKEGIKGTKGSVQREERAQGMKIRKKLFLFEFQRAFFASIL